MSFLDGVELCALVEVVLFLCPLAEDEVFDDVVFPERNDEVDGSCPWLEFVVNDGLAGVVLDGNWLGFWFFSVV